MLVLSDEIYAELTYGQTHCSIATLPGMWERTIVVNGFSKAYAMTGWRLGYSCAPAPIIKQMLKLHQYGIMCASTASQFAGVEAVQPRRRGHRVHEGAVQLPSDVCHQSLGENEHPLL